MNEMMPITVLPDRCTFATDFIPRRLDLPKVLSVPVGQTVELADGAVWDYIEVFGTLTVSRSHNTTAKVTTLIVMPGGVLDLGTEASPIPPTIQVTLIGRDVPLDTTKDPFQWGNGLVNFGQRWAFGTIKTPFVTLAADAPAGATSLTLASAPVGWQVGDEVILPDTMAQAFVTAITPFPAPPPRRETHVTITAISGTTLTLSKPLDFAHLTIKGLDGRTGVMPIVANVTRNIVITSENTNGTRWHTADVGDDACWDLRGYAAVGMGRTTTAAIDDTKPDLTHIGTNPKGRYAEHHHHACHMMPPLECGSRGNVYRGIGSGKWGHVTHGTHDTAIQDNIALGFPGAGIVVEAGFEVRNVFSGNLACYNSTPDPSLGNARANLEENQPGVEGTGFWFHGLQQYVNDNQSWNNSVGINFFGRNGTSGLYPSIPGGMPDTLYDFQNGLNVHPFLSCNRNLCIGNGTGLETWDVLDVPVASGYVGVNNLTGVLMGPGVGPQTLWLQAPTILAQYQSGNGVPVDVYALYNASSGVRLVGGYVTYAKITDGYISGCANALFGPPNGQLIVTDTTLQGAVCYNLDARFADTLDAIQQGIIGFQWTDVTVLPYGQHPLRGIISDFDGRTSWDGISPFPLNGGTPPPPPPPPVWVTLPGVFQQQQSPDPTKFRLCPDASGMNCQSFTKG